jgi:hypothetical protein
MNTAVNRRVLYSVDSVCPKLLFSWLIQGEVKRVMQSRNSHGTVSLSLLHRVLTVFALSSLDPFSGSTLHCQVDFPVHDSNCTASDTRTRCVFLCHIFHCLRVLGESRTRRLDRLIVVCPRINWPISIWTPSKNNRYQHPDEMFVLH